MRIKKIKNNFEKRFKKSFGNNNWFTGFHFWKVVNQRGSQVFIFGKS